MKREMQNIRIIVCIVGVRQEMGTEVGRRGEISVQVGVWYYLDPTRRAEPPEEYHPRANSLPSPFYRLR